MPRDFAALLDELLTQPATEPEVEPAVQSSVDYLAVADELHSGRIRVSAAAAEAEYAGNETDVAAGFAELLAAARSDLREVEDAPSIDPEDIAVELGLTGPAAQKDLGKVRRDFAFDNHPDRARPDLRQRALTRMQIANRLIDDAMRK